MALLSSPGFWFFLLFVGCGVLAVVYNLIVGRQAQIRRDQWRRFAASLGLRYSQDDPFSITATRSLPLFQVGSNRRVYNVASGAYRNREIICFDYQYTVGSGNDSRVYGFTCLLVKAVFAWPELVVHAHASGDWLQRPLFGGDEVKLESNEFNQQFLVRCPDRKFAYDVLHEKAMQFLLDHMSLLLEARGVSVLFYDCQAGQRDLPDGVTELLDSGCAFLDLLPDYLLKERAGPAATYDGGR